MDYEKRNYDNVADTIKESYKLARINQTYQFVNSMHEKYSNIDRCESIWNILEKLNSFTDISDPDCSFPNTLHALQTAEMMRKDDLPDWLQLVGLIHDMGKVMYVKATMKLVQVYKNNGLLLNTLLLVVKFRIKSCFLIQ